MPKTVFTDGDPVAGTPATIVTAAFMNALQNHRHDGADVDGSAPINYAEDTGAANAYEIALSPALTAHVDGMPIFVQIANSNTGASTVAVNALAAADIKDLSGGALTKNRLVSGQVVCLVYCTAASAYILLGARKHPTQTIYTTGSGTYSTPAGCTRVVLRMTGGGAGGQASTGSGGTNGTSGADTTFGALTAGGGSNLGIGGTASGGDINVPGSPGGPANAGNAEFALAGGQGGNSFWGGGGRANQGAAGSNATGYGSGGAGGGTTSIGLAAGWGGGAGGHLEKTIIGPDAEYAYSVGAKGVGASGSGDGYGSGDGFGGIIIADEFYD